MSIKATVAKKEAPPSKRYPKLMAHGPAGEIWLMTARCRGICVSSFSTTIGYESSDIDSFGDHWVDFDGSVTLTND